MSSPDPEEGPRPKPPVDHLEPEVFDEELGYVRERRAAVGADASSGEAKGPADDLVGLALSGGGIRSATFNLGLMQALHRWGIFKHIDYLSTVSGGGFIGSALSALMRDKKGRGFPFGAAAEAGEGEASGARQHKPVIEHLRNNSNYLTPKGLLDVAQIFAVLARGILLNLVVLAPWMLLVCAIVTFVYGPQLWEQATNDSYFEAIDGHLSRHMDRDLEGERAVAAVVRAIELEGLVRPEATAVEPRVRAWLRGEHGDLEALMNSSGLEEVDDDFADGVTRTEVARRLWQANLGEARRGRPLLVSLLVLDEIDEIIDDLALDWEPEKRGMVRELATKLRQKRELGIPLLYDPSVGLPAIYELLEKAGLVELDQGDYVLVDRETTLGRVLLELYTASFFSPRWLGVGSWYASNWSDAAYLKRRPRNGLGGQPEPYELGPWNPETGDVDALLAALTDPAGPLAPGTTRRQVATVLVDAGLIQPAIGLGRFQFSLDAEARPAPGDSVYPRRAATRRARILSESMAALFQACLMSDEAAGGAPCPESPGEAGGRRETAALAPATGATVRTAEEEKTRDSMLRSLDERLGDGPTSKPRQLLSRLRDERLLTEGAPADERLLDLVYLVRWNSRVDGSLAGASCEEPLPELFSDGLIFGAAAVDDPAFAADGDSAAILAALYDLGLLAGTPSYEADLEELACVGRRVRQTVREVFEVERAVRDAELELPLTVAGLVRALHEVDGLLKPLAIDLNIVRELYDRKVVGLGDTHKSYRLLDPQRALWEYLLVLYEGRHFRTAWLEERLPGEAIAYREGEGLRTWYPNTDEFYIDYLIRFDPERVAGVESPSDDEEETFWRRSWAADIFRLPATSGLLVAALWWTLAFPLVILLRRCLLPRGSGTGRPSLLGRIGRRLSHLYERSFAALVIAILAFAFIEIQPYVVYRYHWARVHGETDWSFVAGAVSLAAAVACGPALAFLERFGQRIALAVVTLLGPLLPYLVYLWAMDEIVFGVRIDEYAKNVQLVGPLAVYLVLVFLGLALGIWLVSRLIDVNSSAFHGFYRDRLARAYLVRRGHHGVEPADELRLTEICAPSSGAPYHLINAALNLQASGDESLRDRASDFFLFSRFFTGGERTGYCRTEELERAAPGLRLAGAMAVSGAAVTPNMGVYSSGGLAPLMALLNIRLGLWVPHPRHVRRLASHGWLGRLLARLRLHPGPGRLLREIRSGIDDSGALVYLSDGGHLENTGAFELLRRRCRLILVGDGEADPGHSFPALAALMRYARLDLDIEFDIDLAPLRRGADGTAERHVAIGRILYPATATRAAADGVLVYIKSSVTGAEDEVVTEYRARHPLFPHESTADQFFNENQFEAYRDLGEHAVESLFEKDRGPFASRGELVDWLDERAPER